MSEQGKKSYGTILKSSAIIGGSTVVNMGLAVVRGKFMALLLGPGGVGFLGMYSNIVDLTRSFAGLGINSSGVRQIAEAVGTGDNNRIARTVITLRRVAFYSGALGALLLLAFSKPIARYSFGDDKHTWDVAGLALAAFFLDVSAGQGALIQGMRRIADLARMNVLGAIYGTVFSVLIVYKYGAAGLVPSLICVAAMSILTSWWYARKVKVEKVPVTTNDLVDEASSLLKLGVVFMASALLPLAATYLVRSIILQKLDIDAAGYYAAAWALGGYYIGFILQAMGADFFPRLTAVANDHPECNRLVNEQTEVGILMACPGILAALAFAPPLMTLFYSHKFGPSTEIFRWICLGMLLRVLVWPMGFIIMAKGERKLFLWTELFSNIGFVAFAWVGLQLRGLQGVGIGFFALYVCHFTVIYFIVRHLSGFRWSAASYQLGLVFLPLVALVFALPYIFPRNPYTAAGIGAAVTIPAGIFSIRTLCTLIPFERLPKPAQKIITLFRLRPASTNA
ncbi:MAG TPA: O-antigen translocase [Verrucomicrobiae bacterium]|nr:O-antigen translocase [Verrucomicrobiae bacterium]